MVRYNSNLIVTQTKEAKIEHRNKEKLKELLTKQLRSTNDDIIDGDENQLHEKSDESHHNKPNRRSSRDLGEFYRSKTIKLTKLQKNKDDPSGCTRGRNKKKKVVPLRSGLWQRFTRRTLSLAKSLSGSKTESKASIFRSSKSLSRSPMADEINRHTKNYWVKSLTLCYFRTVFSRL